MEPLDQEDIKVIIDCFIDRLPMVWYDAYEEVIGGKDVAKVVEEMKDGHILRILRKLGYDTKEFIEDFVEFMSDGNSH